MFKPLKTVPLALLAMAGSAEALTLGQIHVQSFINEPLKAVIDVNKASADELKALKVKLANKSAFGKAGIDYTSDIQQLRFSVVESPNGTKIEVTSAKSISEPFLSFVIDADWNKGSVSKDYTVLLDPPIYTDRFAAPIAPADAGVVRRDEVEALAPVVEEPKKEEPKKEQAKKDEAKKPEKVAEKKPEPPKKKPVAKPAAPGDEDAFGPTVQGNNLWSVAKTHKPSAATVQQTMVAIQEANPDAFMRGNMNLMKQGQLLRIPPDEVIEAISQIAAENRVKQHQRALRAGRAVARSRRLSPELNEIAETTAAMPADTESAAAAGLVSKGKPGTGDSATGDKPGTSSSTASATQTEQEGRLKLASAGNSASDSANGDPGQQNAEMEELKNELIKAREDALSAQEESKELEERNKMLEDQLDSQKKLIQLQNEQLAKLQEFYRQLNEQQEAGESLEMPQIPGLETAASASTEASAESETTAVTETAEQPATETAETASEEIAAEETPAAEETVSAAEESTMAAEEAATETGEPAEMTASEETETETTAAMPPEASEETATEETAAEETASEETETVADATEASEPETEASEEAAPAKSEPSFIAKLMNNDMALYGGAATGVGILGLLGLWLLRRRKSTDDGFDDDDILAAELASGDTFGDDIDLYGEPDAAAEASDIPKTDPFERINPLIAYKDYDQAKELLEEAILDEPERFDLHLKMMDVMHASGDQRGFEEHLKILEAANLQTIDEEAWSKVQEQHNDLLASAEAPAAEEIETASIAPLDDIEEDLAETAADIAEASEEAEEEVLAEAPAIDEDVVDLFPGVEEETQLEKASKLDTSLDDISFEDIENLPELSEDAALEDLDLNLDEEGLEDEESEAASIGEDLDLGDQEDLESALKLFELELEERDTDAASIAEEAQAGLSETAEILATDDMATPVEETDVEDLAADDESAMEISLAEEAEAETEAETETESTADDEPLFAADDEDFSLEDFAMGAEEEAEEIPEPEAELDSELEAVAEMEAPEPEAEVASEPEAAQEKEPSFDLPPVSEEEVQAKVELAEAFAEMGDVEGAREILDEVMREGNDNQRNTAQEILQRYAS